MKKLFIILFLLTVSFRVAAQNEQTKDSTLLNRFPTEMGKEPLSPPPGTTAAPNRDMSVKTSLSTDSTDLHITLPTYYPNFPWMDIRMGKMVSSYDPFVMDYEHYGAFQLSPNSILSTFSTYNTYPTMGTIIQSGADFIYRPNERWELTGGMYTAKYTIPSHAWFSIRHWLGCFCRLSHQQFPSYPLFRAIFRLWQTKLSERIYESDVSTKPLRCSHGSENQ